MLHPTLLPATFQRWFFPDTLRFLQLHRRYKTRQNWSFFSHLVSWGLQANIPSLRKLFCSPSFLMRVALGGIETRSEWCMGYVSPFLRGKHFSEWGEGAKKTITNRNVNEREHLTTTWQTLYQAKHDIQENTEDTRVFRNAPKLPWVLVLRGKAYYPCILGNNYANWGSNSSFGLLTILHSPSSEMWHSSSLRNWSQGQSSSPSRSLCHQCQLWRHRFRLQPGQMFSQSPWRRAWHTRFLVLHIVSSQSAPFLQSLFWHVEQFAPAFSLTPVSAKPDCCLNPSTSIDIAVFWPGSCEAFPHVASTEELAASTEDMGSPAGSTKGLESETDAVITKVVGNTSPTNQAASNKAKDNLSGRTPAKTATRPKQRVIKLLSSAIKMTFPKFTSYSFVLLSSSRVFGSSFSALLSPPLSWSHQLFSNWLYHTLWENIRHRTKHLLLAPLCPILP